MSYQGKLFGGVDDELMLRFKTAADGLAFLRGSEDKSIPPYLTVKHEHGFIARPNPAFKDAPFQIAVTYEK